MSQPIWEKIADTHRVTLLANGNVTFWDWVKANPRLPIVLTEGAKKAGALMTAGYCAIALPGIDNGSRNVDAYLAGELPMLDDESELLSEENNKRFEIVDEWEPASAEYLENREIVSVGEILDKVFDKEIANFDRTSQMRVSKDFRESGRRESNSHH